MNHQDVLDFWIDEVGPAGWYKSSEDLDQRIRDKFEPLWEKAMAGGLEAWGTAPDSALALLIVLDQFPRNMFRGQAKAFASDKKALCVAKKAVERRFDTRIPEPQRQFFYLPMMHSECLSDQERCVRLMKTRMSNGGADNLRHAQVHRDIIRRFGRFPYRNEALQRAPTGPEIAFQENGGYQETLRALGG